MENKSILKQLKDKSKTKEDVTLKGGIVLLLDKQSQFNQLATLFQLEEDSIIINGIYVAYMDEYPSIQIEPIANLTGDIENAMEAFKHKNLKPMDFDKWYRKFK